ncbi:Cof-type HAD-IIB family hydrolase [Thermovenabulum gondwanense]|uniref:Sugar phosphatase YidA n=1 Tax=Thermovenabulum gondwanense TaxID=520767 RepID=A0A162MKY1_9FIRM|nr:Cof-type HAD-IIB family hydrolase [Thermovenabulum gondwanense]KYO66520.1 Sugar phosphatase YidA [Thermovenabulum gondwanense]
MEYRLIVTDLDGTLLDENKNIPEENMRAIEAFRKKGGLFTIATGRGERGALPYIKKLNLDIPAVLFNGGELYDPQKGRIYTVYLERKLYDIIIDHFMDNPEIGIVVHYHDKVFISEIKSAHDYYINVQKVIYDRVYNLKEIERANKILLVGDVALAKEEIKRIEQKYGININAVQSDKYYFEILPENVSKGEGLKKLCDYLKIPLGKACAVGDNFNDISLLKTAGLGVAVENAEEPLKKKARFITRRNDEGGVAFLIEKILLGKMEPFTIK